MRKTARVPLTHAPTIHHHFIADRPIWVVALFHCTGQIDTGNQRIRSNNWRGRGHGQGIFIVDCAVVDLDQDAGIGERGVIDRSDIDAVSTVLFCGEQSSEHMGYLV